jgi:hypothetical protein
MLKFLQTEKDHVHDDLAKKFPTYEALLVSLMPFLWEIAAPLPGDKRFVMLCLSCLIYTL